MNDLQIEKQAESFIKDELTLVGLHIYASEIQINANVCVEESPCRIDVNRSLPRNTLPVGGGEEARWGFP